MNFKLTFKFPLELTESDCFAPGLHACLSFIVVFLCSKTLRVDLIELRESKHKHLVSILENKVQYDTY